MEETKTDVLILGAGAAGLLCAAEAGKRRRRTIVLDHARRAGEKIRISGGGRCNFTHLHTRPENFLSQNPRFCVSALARYTPRDFVELVEKHGIAYHEKAPGQLFCDGLAHQIVDMLVGECREAGVGIRLNTAIESVSSEAPGFRVHTSNGVITCESLVVTCGGLSIPKMGATNLGYRIATQFGLALVATAPALVPFTMAEPHVHAWAAMAGVAVDAEVACGRQRFRDAVLFTHRGLSGPGILQISSYWNPGDRVQLNLTPGNKAATHLLAAKSANPRQEPVTAVTSLVPKRLAQKLVEMHLKPEVIRLADVPQRDLLVLAAAIDNWEFVPNGTEGYRTAEVTRGGVDTAELSSKTMESKKTAGLYFAGEVVDVTGHLGGYNFQWAWASGFVAGQYA